MMISNLSRSREIYDDRLFFLMSQLDLMHTIVKRAEDDCSWIESVNEDRAERKFIDLMQSTLLLLLL